METREHNIKLLRAMESTRPSIAPARPAVQQASGKKRARAVSRGRGRPKKRGPAPGAKSKAVQSKTSRASLNKKKISKILSDKTPLVHPAFKHAPPRRNENLGEKHKRVLKALKDMKEKSRRSRALVISTAPGGNKHAPIICGSKSMQTLPRWTLEDYFVQTELQIKQIKTMSDRNAQKPETQKRLLGYRATFKKVASALHKLFDSILARVREANNEAQLRVGLNWLEAVTFEIMSQTEFLIMVNPAFLKSLLETLAFVWGTCFEKGWPIWKEDKRPSYTTESGFNWSKMKGKKSALFLKLCDDNLKISAKRMKDVFAIFGQARDSLEILVWELTHQKILENGLLVSPKHDSVSPIFECLRQVQKMMK